MAIMVIMFYSNLHFEYWGGGGGGDGGGDGDRDGDSCGDDGVCGDSLRSSQPDYHMMVINIVSVHCKLISQFPLKASTEC